VVLLSIIFKCLTGFFFFFFLPKIKLYVEIILIVIPIDFVSECNMFMSQNLFLHIWLFFFF
jgi:hypothetical protein